MTKLVKERNKKRVDEKDTITLLMEYMVTFFALALVILLPIYLENGYYKIGDVKYSLYENITKVGLPILGVMVILYFICNYKKWNVQRILKNLSALDYAVIAYLICALISSALSDYPDKVWNGYSGWFMGLYSQISFVCIYFFLSRYAENAKAVLFCLCLTAGCVYLLGVLNRFLIDPLGVYDGLEVIYKRQFLSTLGQSSWYSAFVCTVLPAGVYFFWSSKKRWLRVLSGIFSYLGFSTLVTQNSDSAYVALFAFMMTFFWFSVENIWYLQRFLQILILFFVSTKSMYIFTQIRKENMIPYLDTLSQFLINSNSVWVLFAVCLIVWIGLLLCEKKRIYNSRIMKDIRNVFCILIGSFVIIAIVCLVFGAKGILPENIMSILSQIPYLTWSETWGNGRGFSWSFTENMFESMGTLKKIFGLGPECYPYYAYEFNSADLTSVWSNNVLTNAHNEWFNSIVNYGLVGGLVYLGIFVLAIARFAKKKAENKILIGILACVLSYVGHNFFCYQTVLCTPFVFLIMGIGEWYSRKTKDLKK